MTKKLRIEQRQGEPPDIFAMRAFAMAMPMMDSHSLHAAAGWISDISVATIKREMMAESARLQKLKGEP